MPYCTLEDIESQLDAEKLIQLTDDLGTGEIDVARVERAIADADAFVDGYVGSRYRVPLNPVPGIIRTYSVDVAVYNLYARRDVVPEARLERFKGAVRFLGLVAQGKVSLGAHDPDGNPPATDAPRMSSENPGRTFTRKSMDGF